MTKRKRFPDHLHRFKKIDIGRGGSMVEGKWKKNEYHVFKCMIPSCNHYIREDLAEGTLCSCNRCNEPMVLDKRAILLTRPHCFKCIKRKARPVTDAISEFLAE